MLAEGKIERLGGPSRRVLEHRQRERRPAHFVISMERTLRVVMAWTLISSRGPGTGTRVVDGAFAGVAELPLSQWKPHWPVGQVDD